MGSSNLNNRSFAPRQKPSMRAGFRMIVESAVDSIERMTGMNISAESKRMARLGLARKETFNMNIRRYSVSEPVTDVQNASAPIFEEMHTAHKENTVNHGISLDNFSDRYENNAMVHEVPAASMAATASGDVEAVAIQEFNYVAEEGIVEGAPIEDVEDPYFTELYESLAAEIIVNDIMPGLVPEMFIKPPEYVISEITELPSEETVIEIYDPFIDDVCESLVASIIVSDIMPGLVPEVFTESIISEITELPSEETVIEIYDPFIDDICETLTAEIIVNEIMPGLMPEMFADPFIDDICETLTAEIIVNEIMPGLVPEVFADQFIDDICETLTAEIIVNEIMPELVPEVFADPFIDDVCETLTAEIIVNEIMPELVPELSEVPAEIATVEPPAVSMAISKETTPATFTFSFLPKIKARGSKFAFIFGINNRAADDIGLEITSSEIQIDASSEHEILAKSPF